MKKRVLKAAIAALVMAASSLVAMQTNAAAADPDTDGEPTQSWNLNGASTDPIRGVFHQHGDGGGFKLYARSSTGCTSTTRDHDLFRNVLPTGWNDDISSVQDSAGCDVKLFFDYYNSPAQTGWIHTNGAVSNLLDSANDRASAYAIS